jgi:pilus assembly protein CpaC
MKSPDDRIRDRAGPAWLALAIAGAFYLGLAAPASAQIIDPGSVKANQPPPGFQDNFNAGMKIRQQQADAATIAAQAQAQQADAATIAAQAQAAAATAPPPPPSGPVRIVAGPPMPSGIYAEVPARYLVELGSGKSQVLDVKYPYSDLMLADPRIADIIPLSNHTIYIVAKALGSTSLSVYGPGRRLVAAVNLVVGPDLEGFKLRLHEILPDETDITVRPANQSIIMTGTVSNPVALGQAVQIAELYAPGKVINMLGVEGTQQVMLSVRFVEMERTDAKNLAVTLGGSTSNKGGTSFTTGFGQPLAGAYGTAALSFTTGAGNLSLAIDALETKGVAKTLAEPTLVAMSGDTASFLAGGEVPIPTAQAGAVGAAAITVTLEQFGIGLAFTPTLLSGGVINLVVKPEVSSLDPANGVTVGGFVVPGLKVTRASTTVELRDGESFTIAGLLSDSYSNNINQFPFLGDVPVLGALFRSPNFTSDKTELVIVVTPHLVTARRGRVALPSDHFTEPSDFELFLFGSLNGATRGAAAEDRALMSRDPSKGGIDGPYGHVLY